MKLLWGASESINVKGAYFEVLSDMLGSLGVIVAAVVVLLTGWTLVDPHIPRRHTARGQRGANREASLGASRRNGGALPPCLDHHLRSRCDKLPSRHR
ncbi:hypothetical protein ACFPOB_29625 [Bosea eneae]|uniref:Cation efflux protein transmembrane domain-containing protein n=1 Tax=Bosea eneae TaxID=151454 RepID=A0ABW0J0W0_9HYPH